MTVLSEHLLSEALSHTEKTNNLKMAYKSILFTCFLFMDSVTERVETRPDVWEC